MKHLTILLATLLFLLAGCGRRTPEEYFPTTDPNDHRPVVHGIDVSHHNVLEWKNLQRYEHLQFMYAKATEGATFQDDKFEYHRQFAKEHHLKFGAYHFLSAKSTVADQFANFKRVAGRCDCLPMLDIEGWTFNTMDTLQLQNMVDEWITYCQDEWHVKPIVYCSARIYGKLNLRGCPWWANAEACRNANNVHTPEPRGDYAVWQFSVYKDTTAINTTAIDTGNINTTAIDTGTIDTARLKHRSRRPTPTSDSVDVNFLRPGTSLKAILMPTEESREKARK